MKWRFGAIGLDYRLSGNSFFPPDVKPKDHLKYYATHFGAIETDGSFYKLPSEDLMKKWRDAVPEDFVIGMKCPKQITHAGGLDRFSKDEARSRWSRFVELANILGASRTLLVVQLPGTASIKLFDELAAFLARRDYAGPVAVELRGAAWHMAETAAMLREQGVIWGTADVVPDGEGALSPGTNGAKYLPQRPVTTTPLRLVRICTGSYGRAQRAEETKEIDNTARIKWWIDQLSKPDFPEGAPETTETIVIVSDKIEAFAMPTIARWQSLVI